MAECLRGGSPRLVSRVGGRSWRFSKPSPSSENWTCFRAAPVLPSVPPAEEGRRGIEISDLPRGMWEGWTGVLGNETSPPCAAGGLERREATLSLHATRPSAAVASPGGSGLSPEGRAGHSGKSVVIPFSLAVDPARLTGRPAVNATPVSGDLPWSPRLRGGAPFGRRSAPISQSKCLKLQRRSDAPCRGNHAPGRRPDWTWSAPGERVHHEDQRPGNGREKEFAW